MPFNGAGTFTLPAGNPVSGVSNSTVHNNTNSEIAVALTNCVTRDGQSPATANIPMAGFKITGLGAGATTGDSVTYEQLQAVLALTVPMPPQGSIIPWVPGYFTDGSNGGYTNVLGTANTVASANTYLNASGWYVCDGAAVNDAASAIFNGASRYLPNLTDSRFLMGSTVAGGLGGSNTMAHTHDVEMSVHSHPVDPHNHQWYDSISGAADKSYNSSGVAANISNKSDSNTGISVGSSSTLDPDLYTSNTTATTTTSGQTETTGAASDTENRPLFLSCFYIMRVK